MSGKRGPRYGPEHRRQVRNLYCYQRLSLEVISEKLGIAVSSLRNWKNAAARDGDDWNAVRVASDLADSGYKYAIAHIMELYLAQHKVTMAGLENDKDLKAMERANVLSSLAYSLKEMRQSVTLLNPEMNKLALAIEIIQRLTTFVRDEYPQHTAVIVEILEPFGEAMAKRYG